MQTDKDLKCLDDLIAGLGGADHGLQSNGPSRLLVVEGMEKFAPLVLTFFCRVCAATPLSSETIPG